MKDNADFIKEIEQRTTIIDYCKENPSLLIASASGMIAILTFLVSSFSYLSLKITLNEYFIYPEMIKYDNQGSLFYKAIAILGYWITICIIQYFIEQIFNRYITYSALKKFCSITKYVPHNEYEQFTPTYLKKGKRIILTNTVLKTMLCIIPLAMVSVLFNVSLGFLSGTTLAFLIPTIIAVIIGAVCLSLNETQKCRRKSLEKRIKHIQQEKDEDQVEQEYKSMFEELLSDSIDSITPYKKITNKQIISSIIAIGFAIICSFFFAVFSSVYEVRMQKNYQIYTDNGKEYAVVYGNANYYIMEEVWIYDDNMIILCNRQRIIVSDDLSTEYRHFKDVQKGMWPEEHNNMQLEEIINNLNKVNKNS